MALVQRLCPDDVKTAFLNVLELLDDPNRAAPLVVTLPVIVLGLRNLAHGIVTRGAKQPGWQFLSIVKGGVTSGDVPNWDPGGEPPAASRSRGPALEKAYAAWESLKDLDQVQKTDIDYEPLALRIPGLHIEALWLRRKPFSEQLDQDFVVPFHSFDRALSAKPYFSMPAFLKVVQPLAEQQLRVAPPPD